MDPAGLKWLQLFFDIVNWEFGHSSDGQLLSEGADRLVDRYPVAGRVFIVSVGAIITGHLANLFDERWDPMSQKFWKGILGEFRGISGRH